MKKMIGIVAALLGSAAHAHGSQTPWDVRVEGREDPYCTAQATRESVEVSLTRFNDSADAMVGLDLQGLSFGPPMQTTRAEITLEGRHRRVDPEAMVYGDGSVSILIPDGEVFLDLWKQSHFASARIGNVDIAFPLHNFDMIDRLRRCLRNAHQASR